MRGAIPLPWSRTATVTPAATRVDVHDQQSVGVGVGMDDHVGTRLADGEPDVVEDLRVESEDIADAAEQMADDSHVLRTRGNRELEVG